MPTLPLPDDLRALLVQPNPCVMATLRRDGSPVTVATWFVLDGDRVLLNIEEGRTRLGHVRRDPRVSLTVLSGESWYTHVSLQGRVTEIHDDPDLVDIDRLSTHYTGQPYGVRDKPRTTLWVEIDRWHGWDNGTRRT